MKTGTIVIVGVCVVAAAGIGYYLFTGKSPLTKDASKLPKNVTKEMLLQIVPEADKELFNGIVGKMSQGELTDTYLVIEALPKIEAGTTTMQQLFEAYPGLKERMEAISKKYNIFT